MPAETHQRGSVADSEEVARLLAALLGDRAAEAPNDVTLASLGVADDYALGDLWDVVRAEFGERSLGPTDGAEELDSAMTVAAVAMAMSRLLAEGRAEPDDLEAGRGGAAPTGVRQKLSNACWNYSLIGEGETRVDAAESATQGQGFGQSDVQPDLPLHRRGGRPGHGG